MPSVNPKLEKQASTEAVDPIRQALVAVEHKIRNLEKRKVKLEQYRDIVKNGGELNADQKSAVAKYDEVLQTLDITRDLFKTITGIANDVAKQQKKIARKEAAERLQQDITKVWQVLLMQNILTSICEPPIREDFINGTNGAVKLTEEELKLVDQLCSEVYLRNGETATQPESTFAQQKRRIAEHYVLVVEGKQKDFAGSTYSEVKKVITSIQNCGYFEKAETLEVLLKKTSQTHGKEQMNANVPAEQAKVEIESNNLDKDLPTQPQPESISTIGQPIIPPAMPLSAVETPFPIPPTHPPMPLVSDPAYMNVFPTPPLPHQIPNQLSHQASALAAGVQQPQPSVSPVSQQQQQQEPRQDVPPPQHRSSTSPPMLNDVISEPAVTFCFLQDSELDHPEASVASSISQAPAVHIPSAAAVVASAVSLNAIPTQTFTNQTFAPSPHVVPAPIIYPTPDITHLPTFGSANPPPPIPMPPSHATGLQFSQQSMGGFPQQAQTFEQQMKQQEAIGTQKEEIHDNLEKNENEGGINLEDMGQTNSSTNWGDASNDWSQDTSPQSGQDLQKSQSWGDQPRNNFRGRGPRRGNTNGYRGRGGYQQNGRNSYYRSNNDGTNNYQNGYQQRNNWNSNNGDGGNNGGGNGGGNYNTIGYKRSTSNQSRGPPRGDRNNIDRPPRIGGGPGGPGGNGGQFRGPNQRGLNPRSIYAPRGGKPQTQN